MQFRPLGQIFSVYFHIANMPIAQLLLCLLLPGSLAYPILPLHRVKSLSSLSLPAFSTVQEFLSAVQVPLHNFGNV